MLVQVGFRAWLSFLTVAWGVVAASMAFISSAWSFYLLRFLLGAFEAGAFPAMWFMLSCFFTRRRWAWQGGGAGACMLCCAGLATQVLRAAVRTTT